MALCTFRKECFYVCRFDILESFESKDNLADVETAAKADAKAHAKAILKADANVILKADAKADV